MKRTTVHILKTPILLGAFILGMTGCISMEPKIKRSAQADAFEKQYYSCVGDILFKSLKRRYSETGTKGKFDQYCKKYEDALDQQLAVDGFTPEDIRQAAAAREQATLSVIKQKYGRGVQGSTPSTQTSSSTVLPATPVARVNTVPVQQTLQPVPSSYSPPAPLRVKPVASSVVGTN